MNMNFSIYIYFIKYKINLYILYIELLKIEINNYK